MLHILGTETMTPGMHVYHLTCNLHHEPGHNLDQETSSSATNVASDNVTMDIKMMFRYDVTPDHPVLLIVGVGVR